MNESIDKETGEIIKIYETQNHLNIKDVISKQISYVHSTLRDENDPDKFARLSPNVLSLVLMELTGMYEFLSTWLANEKLHIADLKGALDLKFASKYCELKATKGETNETSRMKAKIYCASDEETLNKYKHGYDVIEAWKKTIGRYHDTVRSQLSYEKSMGMMSKD